MKWASPLCHIQTEYVPSTSFSLLCPCPADLALALVLELFRSLAESKVGRSQGASQEHIHPGSLLRPGLDGSRVLPAAGSVTILEPETLGSWESSGLQSKLERSRVS